MTTTAEPILEPDQPIVDPHHHLWDSAAASRAKAPPPTHGFSKVTAKSPRYLLDELLADLGSGHKVIATVYLQCGSMYRADGPAHLRPVGETEFVNGVAAMTASGLYGPVRACAGIMGHADLTLGDLVAAVATGFAGAFALCRRDLSSILPGVAIAISLVPPLGVVGVCVGQGEWQAAFGALVLFVSNVVALVIAGSIVFTICGYARTDAAVTVKRGRAYA
ncbi:MAG: DUF389 domain-containing protein, partial [Alphaproteobacteria bacterium]